MRHHILLSEVPTPPRLRKQVLLTARCFTACARRQYDGPSYLPRIANPATWRAIVPKSFKRRQVNPEDVETSLPAKPIERGGNSGISLAVYGIFIGSFAISIMTVRTEMTNFTRKTETKLSVLREVIQQVKNGDEVDAKRLLGTGDPASESEWEEVVRELETYDALEATQRKKTARRLEREKQQAEKEALRQATIAQYLQAQSESSGSGQKQDGPRFLM